MGARPVAVLSFDPALHRFLAPARRGRQVPVEVDRARSAKDAIESLGVPHTEVDLIVVEGVSVGFEYHLQPRDRVAIYPVFESLDISPLV
ncbi:MAG: Mut7-C RNAse domain-containing protein, partial [Burkholderiales bacterium]